MQTVNHYLKNYVEPIIYHQNSQLVFKLGLEVIKIIAAKIFLEYLGNKFLNHSNKISKSEVHDATVFAPMWEEVIFRLVILKTFHIMQLEFSEHFETPYIHSSFFPPSIPQESATGRYAIPIHLPPLEEAIYQGAKLGIKCWRNYQSLFHFYLAFSPLDDPRLQNPHMSAFVIPISFPLMEVVDLVNKIAKFIFARTYFRSTIFGDETQESDSFKILITLPLEQELLYREIKWIKASLDAYELTEEEKNEQFQRMCRVQLTALIFAAAHLLLSHANKEAAITQFVWSYIGGVTYGYLCEKYHSLAPGILAHGINNSIVLSVKVVPEEMAPLILLAIVVNRFATYLLGTTSIDKVIIAQVSQILNGGPFFPEYVAKKDDQEVEEAIDILEVLDIE